MKTSAKILAGLFIAFWMAFIFLDYWQKHPVYFAALRHFSYPLLGLFLLALGAGFVWFLLKYGRQKRFQKYCNGLALFALFMLVSVASVGLAYSRVSGEIPFTAGKAAHVLGLVGGTALATYLIVLLCYVAGSFLFGWLKIAIRKEDEMPVSLATGVMALVMLLFLLGAVSLLHLFTLLPAFVALLIFGRKKALFFLKRTLWSPIAIDAGLNRVGAGAFFLLLALVSINFTAINVPLPPGFDTLTLYANLPSLIAQHNGLVGGFQPYNWSLLMSLGHVLFRSTEVSLALSNLGGVLALFALYALGRNWLRMNVNYTLAALLVFALTPAFTIQSFGELKVDLGLLFVYCCIVLLLLNYFQGFAEKTKPARPPLSPELLLIGLLSGFSLGIKLTTLYFALALVCALWYAHAGRRGFFAAAASCLFLILLLKLDDVSGLRQYHLGAGALQWGLLAAALLLGAGVFIENKQALQNGLRSTAVYGAFLLLPFLPWLVKNAMETSSFSPQKLMNGRQPGPEINLQLLEQKLPKNPGQ